MSSNTIDQYCANIFSVIKLAQRRFENSVIPVANQTHWITNWNNYPWWSGSSQGSRRAWDNQHDVALIKFTEMILALVKLVRELPFPDAARKTLSLLIRIKSEIYGVSELRRHKISAAPPYIFQSDLMEPSWHPGLRSFSPWLHEAKCNTENWETSAFAIVHRLIDREAVELLSIYEAFTWDISDELDKLITAREDFRDCLMVPSKEGKCLCYAIFQPLADRIGAMWTENRVNEAVMHIEGLPAEIVEAILSWTLIFEGKSAVRDPKAAGGFRVHATRCSKLPGL
jgi:hypothetical protein